MIPPTKVKRAKAALNRGSAALNGKRPNRGAFSLCIFDLLPFPCGVGPFESTVASCGTYTTADIFFAKPKGFPVV